MRRTKTTYEWKWEKFNADQDIDDCGHSNRLLDLREQMEDDECEICLVRDIHSTIDGNLDDRQHAYIFKRCDDFVRLGVGERNAIMPREYHNELEHALKVANFVECKYVEDENTD